MNDHEDFTIVQIFSRPEQDFLHMAARRTEEVGDGTEGFVQRVGQIADELRTDEVEPAVVQGRFSMLLYWFDHDPAFADRIYRDFLESISGR